MALSTPLSYATASTRLGMLLMIGSERGLRALQRVQTHEEATRIMSERHPDALEVPGFFKTTVEAIEAYLAGSGALCVPYDLVGGTALQRIVWLTIAKIPYGETLSYSALAQRVGFPNAVRAVASACGANPLPLVIPCHRVVAKDGTFGGFSFGGAEVKEMLLALEKPSPKQHSAVA